MSGCADGCRVVASVIIPPVGVFLKVGFSLPFWVNIVLTLLGYIPGLVHAVWVIARAS
ncbi:MAG: YqaE/Pmp3 family membrane protein [Anaerolineae bacterium]|nr:YqaE/Pmp3 family membrane protein [Anaerolineae bacterium]NIN99181.1 YqaE/Pmp3 family membrane protein [Anaerolineae bacterium]NIQ82022.1 YqaE/Pmp3 family membrane protein [Anaerolineae bacterium]